MLLRSNRCCVLVNVLINISQLNILIYIDLMYVIAFNRHERKNTLNRKNDSIFWVQLKSGDECDSQNFTHFNAIAQIECISSECELNGLKCWLFQLHFILIKAPENCSRSRGAPSHYIYSTFIIVCILIFVYF